ncbi:hypothetical protein [Paenibacillus sp. y28]|uniref:hypothetical protein n=1 Tax=Paenibacillus sp. y28 TaxID=3129110 RepID=UPI00301B5445
MNTMENTSPAPLSQQAYTGRAAGQARSNRKTYILFFLSWMILIALGTTGTMLYTNYLKQQVAAEISQQTQAQLATIQADYEAQIKALKDSYTADMTALQTKVDSLNELLAFAKDNANNKNDNSNQLYTQLNEVKSKLDDLKKNLDVLK